MFADNNWLLLYNWGISSAYRAPAFKLEVGGLNPSFPTNGLHIENNGFEVQLRLTFNKISANQKDMKKLFI